MEILSGFFILPIFIFIFSAPIFLFFETYHLLHKKNSISYYPVAKGLFVGFVSGLAFVVYGIIDATGESGLGFIAVSPFFLLCSLISGFLVGSLYKKRKKRLLPIRQEQYTTKAGS